MVGSEPVDRRTSNADDGVLLGIVPGSFLRAGHRVASGDAPARTSAPRGGAHRLLALVPDCGEAEQAGGAETVDGLG